MIQIKPKIDHQSTCPHCGSSLKPVSILWQGIHICAVSTCAHCGAEIIEDLRIGHAIPYSYQVDLKANKLFHTNKNGFSWFGEPLLRSLQDPKSHIKINFNIEKFQDKKEVVILNCIDFLYGHSLLKLLNAETHLHNNPEIGLIVVVPTFLRWLVPQGVAEIWTVDIPLSEAHNFLPDMNERIQRECLRFDKIFVSRAHSHPKDFDIRNYSGVQRHNFREEKFRITFIWREDRLWNSMFSGRIRHFNLANNFFLECQNAKITRLFSSLRNFSPHSQFTVAGLGTTTKFPEWIDDQRVAKYSSDIERAVCKVYSESRIVIGVHGSNMLLPSAHAGMTVDLMPMERWSNFAQDILYQESDNRLASYIYRYLPLNVKAATLSNIISTQLKGYLYFRGQMKDEFSTEISYE